MDAILRDVSRAISDVSLELVVTAALLVILFVLGGAVGRASLRRTENPTKSKYKRVGLRVKLRHPHMLDTVDERKSWWMNFWQGISTEFFGAVVTTMFLGMIVLISQQMSINDSRKDDLILQMGSPDNAFAVEAVRQLQALGWQDDGTLRDADLFGTNLQGAYLRRANLQGAVLVEADLQGVNLEEAQLQRVRLERTNLQGADLFGTNLQGANLERARLREAYLGSTNLQGAYLGNTNLEAADLFGTNLQEARLEAANLQGAYLRSTNLQWANLEGADLQGAVLDSPMFNEQTVLPDNTFWTPETDMQRFTNPAHPDFWNPCVELEVKPWHCE